MQIHLLSFGKLRVPGLREAADYYLRNIRPWASVEDTELKAAPISGGGAGARRQVQQKEFLIVESRLKNLGDRKKVFVMDETGQAKTTENWAKQLRTLESESLSHLVFCLGGSLGIDERLKKSSHGIFSLGPQTLSHELARVVLLEQLYRGFSVIRGHPYHNSGS